MAAVPTEGGGWHSWDQVQARPPWGLWYYFGHVHTMITTALIMCEAQGLLRWCFCP